MGWWQHVKRDKIGAMNTATECENNWHNKPRPVTVQDTHQFQAVSPFVNLQLKIVVILT